MRGTRAEQGAFLSAGGLIPTYAGNTYSLSVAVSRAGAHPHVCGEHEGRVYRLHPEPGSSPRMRGTPLRFFLIAVARGLIPTYAGNTAGRCLPAGFIGAHPHVCGEHSLVCTVFAGDLGSSPRMRGTRQRARHLPCQAGLIPTYAGNTNSLFHDTLGDGAHPHVCGEHKLMCFTRVRGWGSSPRMRGTRCSLAISISCAGLIPTYAGNTSRCFAPFAARRAHPHVCGEHSSFSVIDFR